MEDLCTQALRHEQPLRKAKNSFSSIEKELHWPFILLRIRLVRELRDLIDETYR